MLLAYMVDWILGQRDSDEVREERAPLIHHSPVISLTDGEIAKSDLVCERAYTASNNGTLIIHHCNNCFEFID